MAGALHALALRRRRPRSSPAIPRTATAIEQLRPVVLGAVREHQSRHSRFSFVAPADERGRSIRRAGRWDSADRQGNGLPLRRLEIGASAGLNAIWDRYSYQLGAVGWGDPKSAVRIAPTWEGPSPPIDASMRVIARRACDISPIDLEDAAQRLRLRAYVWADQRERLLRLENAVDLARA